MNDKIPTANAQQIADAEIKVEEYSETTKVAFAVENMLLEIQAYQNIARELRTLALLHVKDATGAKFEESALQHDIIVEDRKITLQSLRDTLESIKKHE